VKKPKILVIDDEKLLRWSLHKYFSKEGFAVFTAESGVKGLELFSEEQPDLVLLDLHLPDIYGIDVLETIRKENPDAVVIIVTALGDIENATKTIRFGAYDFVEKPFNFKKLKILVGNALETCSLRKEASRFRSKLLTKYCFANIIGKSDQMLRISELAKKVAQSDAAALLLQGESGTGKDLIARVIHYESSRALKPFVDMDCKAIPEILIEGELFGYEKGASTGAKQMKKGLLEFADGGTIFLDEIGDIRLGTQAKLFKVLENRTFKRIGGVKDISLNLRVIASTNRDLDQEVKIGNFHEGLYQRLKAISVFLPPLRERPEDIPQLAQFFITKFNGKFKKNVKGLSNKTEQALLDYPWPGNVRELRNVIEHAMILENEQYIMPERLPGEFSPKELRYNNVMSGMTSLPAGGLDIEEVEKNLIKQALEQTKWNQTRAARLLNLTRDALRYRMQKFGFLPEKTKS
jgi:two-component system response regulator AtoC